MRALIDDRALALITAPAGAGKGEVLRAVTAAYQAEGRRVIALAATGDTAQRLGTETGADETRTLDSFTHRAGVDALNAAAQQRRLAAGELAPEAMPITVRYPDREAARFDLSLRTLQHELPRSASARPFITAPMTAMSAGALPSRIFSRTSGWGASGKPRGRSRKTL